MDPLKLRALGVKKPLEEKESYQNQNEYKRYYPVDKQGQIDEWGGSCN